MKESVEILLEKAKRNDRMKSTLPVLKLRSLIRMHIGRDPEMNSPAFLADMCKTGVMNSCYFKKIQT